VNEENVADVQAEVVGPGEFAAPVTRVATKNSLHTCYLSCRQIHCISDFCACIHS
jgi:hypothetical protein